MSPFASFRKVLPVPQFPPDRLRHERDRIDQLRHDVNNPLAIIRGHAQLLQLRLQRPEAWNTESMSSVLQQLAAIDIAVTRAETAIEAFDQAGRPGEEDET